jgi:hypothetical protein
MARVARAYPYSTEGQTVDFHSVTLPLHITNNSIPDHDAERETHNGDFP